MKKLTLFIIVFSSISVLYSQQIGQWKIYSDMKNVKAAVILNDNIWAVTDGGTFRYNPTDNSFITITKANGLNSQNLTAIGLDNNNKLWLGASEGYINIYDPGTGDISRIMDIFNTTETKKGINDIFVKNDSVLVSTDFDLSIINPANLSFYDSFLKIGNFDAEAKIKKAIKTSLIYVLTDNGVAIQKSGAKNLSVPESWNTYFFQAEIPANSGSEIIQYNSKILLGTDSGIYEFSNNQWKQLTLSGQNIVDMYVVNNDLFAISDSVLYKYSNNTVTTLFENDSKTFNGIFAANENLTYISTSNGLLELRNNVSSLIYPDGPQANSFNNMTVDEKGDLWVATGKDVYGIGFMKFDGNKWTLYNTQNTPELPSNAYQNVSTYGNKIFLSNWGQGFTIYNDTSFTTYNTTNSDLVGISLNQNFLAIADVQEDSKNNIWILNNIPANRKQLSVLTNDNKWFHYTIQYLSISDAVSKMVIDQFNTKWFIVENGNTGLYYFNENNTFNTTSDDIQGKMSTNEGLITNTVTSIAVDKRGQLWVGTSEGVNLITDPSRPLTTITKSTAFSVRNLAITCIAVDPLDQKWIGTKQGLYVLSPDGFQLIDSYTSNNSPLPNDNIISIAINPVNGIAYIGTDNGLAALATPSIQPVESFDQIFVYPNPFVINGNDNQITIDGLVKNSSIKILDISSKLIRTITSPGGRIAFWDGKDENGNYVSSGVYILVAYDEEANNVATSKIAVIRK